MAFRDCDHCRKFFYNEETGKPREKKDGTLLERKNRPPCEVDDMGCKKGHWSDPVELGKAGLLLMDSYRACQATGGRSVSEAERLDDFHCWALSLVHDVVTHGDMSYASKLTAISLASAIGSKG